MTHNLNSNRTTARRQKFTFSRQLMDIIDACPDEAKAQLTLAIVEYAMEHSEPDLDGVPAMMFAIARKELDRGWSCFHNACKVPKENRRGGAPRGNNNAAKSSLEEHKTTANQLQNNSKTTAKQQQNNSELSSSSPNKDNNNYNINISLEGERADDKSESLKTAHAKRKNQEDIPMDFVDEKFRPAFNRWLDYKRERKEMYKIPASAHAAYNRLVRLCGGSAEKAAMIVDQSIALQWKGLFPLREERSSSPVSGSAGGNPAAASMLTGIILRDNSTTKYNNQNIW